MSMKEYKFHEYSEIFPLMVKEEYDQLRESVRERGLNHPIILFEGKILDGRNRYLACKAEKVELFYKEYEGNDALQYVFDVNFHRRHLSQSQRACCAAEFNQRFKMDKDAKHKLSVIARNSGKPRNKANEGNRTITKMADLFTVGTGNAAKANTLLLKNKKLFSQVKKGDFSLTAGYNIYRNEIGCSLPKKDHRFSTTIQNINDSNDLTPPNVYCAPHDLRKFQTEMVKRGWIMEMKVMSKVNELGEVEPTFLVNWYGNGFKSKYTCWGTGWGLPDYIQAVVVAGKEILERSKLGKAA